MRQLVAFALVAALAGPVALARAENKADPTGTWKWTAGRGQATLKLKMDNNKLTGTMVGRNNKETPIEDATYDNGQLTFSVTREGRNGKVTMKYNGKISGDTITGTVDVNGQSREWKATRSKD